MSELKAYGMNDPEVGDEYEMYKVSDVDKLLAENTSYGIAGRRRCQYSRHTFTRNSNGINWNRNLRRREMHTADINKFMGMVLEELAKAEGKHPKFCDEVIPPGFDFDEEEKRWKKCNDEATTYYASDIFNEEFYEALNAYEQGDKEHALQELAQCGAVILRMMETIEKEIKNDEITEV